ncbi:MAG: hypothetical protein ACFB21_08015 [Opitutales bacterium]
MAVTAGTYLGFPPPLLGDRPQRLFVYAIAEDWLCLEKPAGIAAEPAAAKQGDPVLPAALNTQIEHGKPEMQRLGLRPCGNVYPLATELSGPVLLAMGKDARTRLRNDYGSRAFTFVFEFWTSAPAPESAELSCEAPILEVPGDPPRISRRFGKRARTDFRLLEQVGGWTRWEARSTFPRARQVYLHAARSGLPVVSEADLPAGAGQGSGFPAGPWLRLCRFEGLDGLPEDWPALDWDGLRRRLERGPRQKKRY